MENVRKSTRRRWFSNSRLVTDTQEPQDRKLCVSEDDKGYKIYKCRQWDERFEVEVTTMTAQGKNMKEKVIALKPTILFNMKGMRITLNTVTIPPTPELTSTFISDGSQIALWRYDTATSLVCDSEEAAITMNCSMNSICVCEPAESTVNCACKNINITKIFKTEVENRLPARRPWINSAAARHDPSTLSAPIPSFLTAELLVHVIDKFDKTVIKLTGRWERNGGGEQFFRVPCQHTGVPLTLVFSSKTGRIQKKLVKCLADLRAHQHQQGLFGTSKIHFAICQCRKTHMPNQLSHNFHQLLVLRTIVAAGQARPESDKPKTKQIGLQSNDASSKKKASVVIVLVLI
ncbi:hypothetical protein RB195_010486 [Necator americanus]|uniref:Phlebovirus glycoprotein G2 fusion domain-containing protein n=1 Tax=Necator americanus TaxID=51031 RepID=A0ABR1CY58_NECAM